MAIKMVLVSACISVSASIINCISNDFMICYVIQFILRSVKNVQVP